MVQFGVLEAIYWGIMATFGAYVVPLALSRGYAQSLVSVMMSVYMVCALVGQFFWSSACDTLGTNKKVFLLGVLLAGAAQLAMFFTHKPLLFCIFYGLFGFSLGPMGSILDTWMLKSLGSDMKAYGVSRSGGSGGYAVAVLIMGTLIQNFGYYLMPICSTAIVLVTLAVALAVPDAEFGRCMLKISAKDVLSILKVPSFVMLLMIFFFFGMAGSPITNLKITILRAVGGDVGTQGLDSFLGCAVQFLLFVFAGTFTRIPAKARLWGGAFCVMGSVVLNFTAVNYWMVIVGTMLSVGSYGLLMPAAREIVIRIIDPKYQTTANGFVDAFYSFLAGTISMLYAGTLVESMGVRFMVLVSLVFSAIPLILLAGQKVVAGQKCDTIYK